jgi:hypothetical protein
MLLGKGDLKYMKTEFPNYGLDLHFKLYYLGTMGYHLHQMIVHCTLEARNDFVEMFLHHVLTIFLYGQSYYLHRGSYGALIMYLHDWADIPT